MNIDLGQKNIKAECIHIDMELINAFVFAEKLEVMRPPNCLGTLFDCRADPDAFIKTKWKMVA